MFLIPRKQIWTQQPQGLIQLDFQHPALVGNSVKLAFVGNDLSQGLRVGTVSPVFNKSGAATYCSGTGNRIDVGRNVSPSTRNCTVILTFRFPSLPASAAPLLGTQSGSNTAGIHCQVASTGTFELTSGDGAGAISNNRRTLITPAGAIAAGVDYTVVAGFTSATTGFIYINGVEKSLTASGTASTYSVGSGNGTLHARFNNSAWVYANDELNLAVVLDNVISPQVAKSISENPWKIFRAPDSRIFVLTGAGAGGGDSLTASSIIAAHATVGSPLLSQQHALTASSIASAPAVVASPAITQRHALSSTAASASPAVVGSPSITQRHALTATAISAGPAIIGLPTLTEIVAGVLSALPIVSAPAVVGAPAITQKHALSAGAISAGPAMFGTPTLTQQHALMAQGVTASPAAVGAPALSEGGAAPFTAEQFLYLEANYVTIANINDIAAAVLAALQATAIPVNIKQVNDVTIKGIGTQSNPWNPV